MVAKLTALTVSLLSVASAMGQVVPQAMPESQIGQSIADVFRLASGADCSFVAAGFLAPTKDNRNLANDFSFGSDELWLVSLTGKQLEDAFERSISFYPEPGPDTLYLSGSEVTFSVSKTNRAKIVTATVGGVPIDPLRTYKVSMPSSLARGGLSYFAVWNFQKPEKVISPAISKLLEGKSVQTSTLRWLSHQSL